MASYYIGMNNAASNFGGGGNFMTQLGQVGAQWEKTNQAAMDNMMRMRNFQDDQMVRPYQLDAVMRMYGNNALQSRIDGNLLEADLRAQAEALRTYNQNLALASANNAGTPFYGASDVSNRQNAKINDVASAPAATGNLAATAPRQMAGQQTDYQTADNNAFVNVFQPTRTQPWLSPTANTYGNGLNTATFGNPAEPSWAQDSLKQAGNNFSLWGS